MTTPRLLALVSAVGIAALAISFGTIIGNGGRAVAADPAAAPAPAESTTFAIDSVHSSIIFKIKHKDAANFYGRFNAVSGSFSLGDTADLSVTVKADSVDSNNSKRDDHIKSPDFLSAKEFPEISFTAKGLTKSGDGAFKGSGELNFHGVKKTIEITLTQTGRVSGARGKLAGVESVVTIKRTDFGVKTMAGPGGLSDEVTLIVALEGNAK